MLNRYLLQRCRTTQPTTYTAEDFKALVVPTPIDELSLLTKTDIPIPDLNGLPFEPDTSK